MLNFMQIGPADAAVGIAFYNISKKVGVFVTISRLVGTDLLPLNTAAIVSVPEPLFHYYFPQAKSPIFQIL